jgi:hypothetical protein
MFKTTLPCGCGVKVYVSGDVLSDRETYCEEGQVLWDAWRAVGENPPQDPAQIEEWRHRNAAAFNAYCQHYEQHIGKIIQHATQPTPPPAAGQERELADDA